LTFPLKGQGQVGAGLRPSLPGGTADTTTTWR